MTREAVLGGGGPFDGLVGEVPEHPLPEFVPMGENGGFIYRLAGVRDGRVRYRYDRKSTAAALRDLGFDEGSVRVAVSDDAQAVRAAVRGPLDGHDVSEGFAAQVLVHRYSDRWELWVNGVLVEQHPPGFLADDDEDGMRHWVESAVHALAREAMKEQG